MNFPRLNASALYTPIYVGLRLFDRELLKLIDQLIMNLLNIFDKGLSFGDNIDCQVLQHTTNSVANTEDAVAHTLKRVPTGYFVVGIDKAGIVYSGTTPATESNIYLRCTTPTTAVKLVIF